VVDINLSKAVRSNLSSLQSTATLMNKTSDRLSTGNKVNSALDNPTNFFTASSLNSRAGDLNQLMDSMNNGIKTIEAADNGLSSITKTLESMQSTLRQARQDKSFQTTSFELGTAAAGTSISFSGGAIGTAATPIALNNASLSLAATGLDAVATATPGAAGNATATSGAAQIAFPAGTPGTLDTGATINFTVTVDGAANAVSIDATDWATVTAETTTEDRAAALAALIDADVTGATVTSDASGAISITSTSTGTN